MKLTEKELLLLHQMINQASATGIETMQTMVELNMKVQLELEERGGKDE